MYRNILLAIDLADARSQVRAVESAVALARTFTASITLITVVPEFRFPMVGAYFPKDYERQAVKAAETALRRYGEEHVPAEIPVRHVVGQGSIYREILRHADEGACDLIIMQAHRPELSDYLLGPNAARVVRHARQSVLVVRD